MSSHDDHAARPPRPRDGEGGKYRSDNYTDRARPRPPRYDSKDDPGRHDRDSRDVEPVEKRPVRSGRPPRKDDDVGVGDSRVPARHQSRRDASPDGLRRGKSYDEPARGSAASRRERDDRDQPRHRDRHTYDDPAPLRRSHTYREPERRRHDHDDDDDDRRAARRRHDSNDRDDDRGYRSDGRDGRRRRHDDRYDDDDSRRYRSEGRSRRDDGSASDRGNRRSTRDRDDRDRRDRDRRHYDSDRERDRDRDHDRDRQKRGFSFDDIGRYVEQGQKHYQSVKPIMDQLAKLYFDSKK